MPKDRFTGLTAYCPPGARRLVCFCGKLKCCGLFRSRRRTNSKLGSFRSSGPQVAPRAAAAAMENLPTTWSASGLTIMLDAPAARRKAFAFDRVSSDAPMIALSCEIERCCKYSGLPGVETAQNSRSSSTAPDGLCASVGEVRRTRRFGEGKGEANVNTKRYTPEKEALLHTAAAATTATATATAGTFHSANKTQQEKT